jgi:hypothetical protein
MARTSGPKYAIGRFCSAAATACNFFLARSMACRRRQQFMEGVEMRGIAFHADPVTVRAILASLDKSPLAIAHRPSRIAHRPSHRTAQSR